MKTTNQPAARTAVKLLDAVAAQRKHPDAFEIPTRKIRHATNTGDSVRIGFIHANQTERMWVRITSRHGDTLHGNLRNVPFLLTEHLNHGQEIIFRDKNILDIQGTGE